MAIDVLRGRAKAATVSELLAARTSRNIVGGNNSRSQREILRAYKTTPWLHAVVAKIAGDVGATEWRLYRGKGSAKSWAKSLSADPRERAEAIKAAVQSGAAKEITEHPLLKLLDRPNPAMHSRQALLQVSHEWFRLSGEAFWIWERNKLGQPMAIFPVPPAWAQTIPAFGQGQFQFSNGSWSPTVPSEDVLWLRRIDPENPYGRGFGTGMVVADEIDTDEAASKMTRAKFENGGTPESIVGVEGADYDGVKRVEADWEKFRGADNAGRSLFINYPLDVTRLDTSNRDNQLLEIRKFERDLIVQIFGVPPEVLGIVENSNRATSAEAKRTYCERVLIPDLEFWRLSLQARLVPEFDESLVLEYVNPSPDDREFALSVIQAAPEAFTQNEARALAGHEPAKGGDKPIRQPFSLGPVPALPGKDDPPWARAIDRGSLRPSRKAFTEREIENVLEALRPEYLTAEMDPVWRAKVEEWARRSLDELGAGARLDLLNPLIGRHLEDLAGNRIRDLVNETTRQELRDSLAEGARAGEDIRDLAARVHETFDRADDVRSETIARTEVIRSSNWATYEAQKISGVVDKRRWIATPDGRTRDTHRALNGAEVGIGEEFQSESGASALHPGGFGDPAEDISCRCTTVAVIADPEDAAAPPIAKIPDAEVWKRFDAEAARWEGEATKALRRGFREQRKAILAAMKAGA